MNYNIRFDPAWPLTNLRPADYNPRFLSDDAFVRLQASLRRHGVVKPVILNADGTLVAGHQRTKALKAIGHTTTPAVILGQKVRLQDEIKFNLLHNRVETEASVVHAEPGPIGTWTNIPWQTIRVDQSRNSAFQQAIGYMTAGHGPWGSVVIDDQGRIVLNAEYAAVAAASRFDVLAWTVPSAHGAELVADLTGDYGVYDWTGLDDQAPVWNQHIVQPTRLRKHSSLAKQDKLHCKSETWEHLVMPWLTKDHRVVDFGAGHGDYAKHLRAQGFHVDDYEPYRTLPGKYAVDVRGVVGMIRRIEQNVRNNGLYDVVVLDSVINATTSTEYQQWVLTTVNALCAEDGIVCIGTRNLLREQDYENASHTLGRDSTRISFLDSENVDMRFFKGKWQKIRYHTPDTLRELLAPYFADVQVKKTRKATIEAVCRKPRQLPESEYQKALDEEFNMPYPNGFRHGRHLELVANLIELTKGRN